MKIVEHFKNGFNSGIKISKKIVIFTFPFYIAVDLLKQLNILKYFDAIFSPVMKLFGLPGEASIGILSGMLLNLYAAIAALTPLELTAKQMTVIETVVLSRTGIRASVVLFTRISVAFIAAFLVNLLWI